MSYGLISNFKATPGNGASLGAILVEASGMMTALDACHTYSVSIEEGDPDSIWVTEIWSSKEAHDASLADGDVRALISRAMPLLAGMPEKGKELRVLTD